MGPPRFPRFFEAFHHNQRSKSTMATKRISQETFDDVVRENMEDFDMSLEDALKDAVEQFTAQGVDLSAIVKTGAPRAASLLARRGTSVLRQCPRVASQRRYSRDADRVSHRVCCPCAGVVGAHPVVVSLKTLRGGPDADARKAALATLATECAANPENGAIASTNNAVATVVDACAPLSEQPEETQLLCMSALSALCNRNTLNQVRRACHSLPAPARFSPPAHGPSQCPSVESSETAVLADAPPAPSTHPTPWPCAGRAQ